MSAVVGSLRVNLGLDSAAFENGLSKASENSQKFSTSVQGAFSGVGRAANQNATAFKALSGQTGNIAAQFQDIGVQLAGGQSPFLIALQQGTQLSSVLGSVGGGARGVGAALASAFGSLLSPVSLLTIGIIAAGGALLQFFMTASVDGKKAEQAMKDFDAIVEKIGQTSASTAAQLKEMLNTPKSWTVLNADIKDTKSELQGALSASISEVAGKMEGLITTARGRAAFAIGPDVANVNRELKAMGEALESGKMSAGAAYERLSEMATASTLPPSLYELIKTLRTAVGDATNLEAKLNAIGGIQTTSKTGRFATVEQKAGFLSGNVDLAARMGDGGDLATVGGAMPSNGLVEALNAQKKSLEDARKPKSTGGSKRDLFADTMQRAKERIDLLKVEQQAIGQTELATIKLRREQELINQAQDANHKITPQQTEALKGLAAQMAEIEVSTKNAREAMDFYKGATKGFLSDLRSGLDAGKGFFEAFGDAAKNVLDKVISKIEDQLVDALFSLGDATQSAGIGGGGGLGSTIGSLFGKLFGFATGGSFQVGGSGGIDSQLVAFKASPNETVSITKPGQVAAGGGGGAVTVNIINNSSAGVRQSQRQTSDGLSLDIIVDEAVAKNMAKPGSATRSSMQGQFGLSNGLNRRG